MQSASIYRARARKTLGGKIFSEEWIFAMLISVAAGAVLGISGPISIVLSGVIYYGVQKYYLERARGNVRHDALGVCIEGFVIDVAGNIVLGILTMIFTFLWSLLFIIPGIIKAYAYSMTTYILADNPNMKAMDALRESERMMQGHKWELFCLHLSYIGWVPYSPIVV